MAQVQPLPFTDITFDVTNDETGKLLSTGRKLVELEAAIVEAKAVVAKALAERQRFIVGVVEQLTK